MRCGLVHPFVTRGGLPERDPALQLEEAQSLVTALDVDLCFASQERVSKIDPGKFFGSGKADEIGMSIKAEDAGLVVVNAQLSPVQQRNLENFWKVKVLDRTGLILEIFGERAQTREGVLQVDLAHLTYQKSRLVRSWTHLERQRGGGGFLGGPGETQIEADRRALDDAIKRIRLQLAKVVNTRELHRASRKKVPFPVVALVGYTNAGKSTLFNKITGSDVLAKDMVFATLDPTMRMAATASGQEIILSDTVGFISDLPTHLVAAFRATLEEVLDADLVVHVRDIAHPETAQQRQDVLDVLRNLGIGPDQEDSGGPAFIEVWNKTDLLGPDALAAAQTAAARSDDVVSLSAVSGAGFDEFLSTIDAQLFADWRQETITLGADGGRARAWLYEHKLVQSEAQDEGDMELHLKWSPKLRAQFHSNFPKIVLNEPRSQ